MISSYTDDVLRIEFGSFGSSFVFFAILGLRGFTQVNMVSNRDAALNGTPFRPALFELAQAFSDWDPRTAPVAGHGSLDIPPSDAFRLSPWHVSSDLTNRIDLSAWAASQHQRIYGFVAAIDECHPAASDNTDAAYRFDVIARIPFLADGLVGRSPDKPSWLYVTDKSD